MRVGAALGLGTALLALAACKSRVVPKDFAGRLRQRVIELGLSPTAVNCPDEVTGTFTCSVEIGGKAYGFEATVAAAEGSDVTFSTRWTAGEAVIAMRLGPSLSRAMTHTLSTVVTVDCGDPLRFLAPDRTLRCDLTAGATKAALITTFDPDMKPTSWKLEPPMLSRTLLETQLAPEVQAKTGSSDTWVHCGHEPLLPRPADGILKCVLALRGREAPIAITVTPTLAVTRWEILGSDAP